MTTFIFYIFCITEVAGGNDGLLPLRFTIFPLTFPEINPALADMTKKQSLILASQITDGGFESVYAFYLNGHTTIFRQHKTVQSVGLSIISDREGKLISRNWIKFQYAIEIPLSEQVRLGSGFHAGFLNYFVRNTAVSPGGSDFAPVFSVGLKLRDSHGHVGFSINQFEQSTLLPIGQEIYLCRHINLTSSYDFQISSRFALIPAVWIRLPDNRYDEYSICTEALFDDLFSFQTLWYYENSLAFSAGLKNLNLWKLNVNFQFSYTVPFGQKILNQFNLYEGYVSLYDY